jgi:hypothetical protein
MIAIRKEHKRTFPDLTRRGAHGETPKNILGSHPLHGAITKSFVGEAPRRVGGSRLPN